MNSGNVQKENKIYIIMGNCNFRAEKDKDSVSGKIFMP